MATLGEGIELPLALDQERELLQHAVVVIGDGVERAPELVGVLAAIEAARGDATNSPMVMTLSITARPPNHRIAAVVSLLISEMICNAHEIVRRGQVT